MRRTVVSLISLFTLALLTLSVALAPPVAACHERDCYNERYVSGGAHTLVAEMIPAPVCVEEPCGEGGRSVIGATTDLHVETDSVVGVIVDWAYGRNAPLGLCGQDAEGDCVANAEVHCGMNNILFAPQVFTTLVYHIPTVAVTHEFETCYASAGTVMARLPTYDE